MSVAHLYQITNNLTGEFYTGVHKGHEQAGYWGSGIRIKRSIKKYGKENHVYKIHVLGDVAEIYALEEMIVDKDVIENNPLCLNLKVGGMGGTIISETVRAKLSGENNHFYGKTHSDETKKKISHAKKGQTYDPEVYVKRNEKHADKYKQSIQNARKFRKQMSATFISPQGENVTFSPLNQCRELGLDPDALSLVNRGKSEQHKGWRKV